MQAALLGLLALLLAFTYSQAASRFELRRQLLVEEANAIGTCWLRASFLPPIERAELRGALRDYARLRVMPEQARFDLPAVFARAQAAQALQTKMWAAATGPSQSRTPTVLDALLVNSLNQLIDLHTSRTASYEYRVPGAVWVMLVMVSALSMLLMGFSFGQVKRPKLGFLIVLALAIAAVTILILDLDQSHRGLIRISQTSLRAAAGDRARIG